MWYDFKRFAITPLFSAIARLSKPEVRIVTGGIAFYTIFSVFPLLYLSITLLFAFLPDRISENLVANITDTLQSVVIALQENDVRALLTVTPHDLTITLSLVLIIVLYTATSGAKAAIMGIRMIAGTEHKTRFFRFHGLSLLMTALLVLLTWTLGVVQVIFATLSNLTGEDVSTSLGRDIAQIASSLWVTKWLASFLVFYVVISLSLRGHIRSGRAMLAGAAGGSMLWVIVTLGFQLYLNVSPMDTIYGALASIIAALIWLMLSVSSLLLGAALATEWDKLIYTDP